MISGKRRHDYDISYRRSAKQMYKEKLTPPDAVSETNEMIERYYEDTGEFPSDNYLSMLADAILSEDLSDSSSNKVQTSEYPILGARQMQNRRSTEVEFVAEAVEYHLYKYADPEIYTFFVKKERVRGAKKPMHRNDSTRLWAMTVKERDGFRCQNPKCRSRNGIMHAHHIYNYADNPDLRDDVSNGITLCEPCHTEFHVVYGKRRTNKGDIELFFGNSPYYGDIVALKE